MIDIKIGQLYSFHRDPKEPIIAFIGTPDKDELIQKCDIVMEVTTIDGFIGVTPVKDRTGWWSIGTEYIAKQSDVIYSGNYRLVWDPTMEPAIYEGPVEVEIEHGMDCPKCKKYYPDAIRATDFKCWACRNGF